MSLDDFQNQKIKANMCKIVYGGRDTVRSSSESEHEDTQGMCPDETYTKTVTDDQGCVTTNEITTYCCPQQ